MHNIFLIDELLQHILSFIPRKLIIPIAITCTHFYNSISIDYNQESVAKNSDMFSLFKIPYSPKVVINIAMRHNNIDMVDYLIKQNEKLLDDRYLCQSIGYIGYEKLISKLNGFNLGHAIVGVCEGSHVELFTKYYDKRINSEYDIQAIISKNNCTQIQQILGNYYIYERQDAKIYGKCAQKNKNTVIEFIKELIEINNFSNNSDNICDGLIDGEHYDIFVWLQNEKYLWTEEYYFCCFNEVVENLIRNNNYQFFTYVLLNHCQQLMEFNIEHKPKYIEDFGFLDNLDHKKFVLLSIDYKRIDFLEFLLKHITFNTIRYEEFISKAKTLQFNNIMEILIANKSLFKDYDDKYTPKYAVPKKNNEF